MYIWLASPFFANVLKFPWPRVQTEFLMEPDDDANKKGSIMAQLFIKLNFVLFNKIKTTRQFNKELQMQDSKL